MLKVKTPTPRIDVLATQVLLSTLRPEATRPGN
jgi:hypothetical protein